MNASNENPVGLGAEIPESLSQEEMQRMLRDLQARQVQLEAENEALRAAQKRGGATAILESISDAFFSMNDDMVVTYFNHAAEIALGRKSKEVLGRKLFEAFPEARGSIFEEQYTRALKEKIQVSFETYFGGSPYENWYEVRVYPSSEGISVFFQVITERKQAKERLEAAHAKLEALWGISSLADATVKKVSDHILASITRMTQSEYGFYGFVNEDESVMTIHAWSGEAMKDCSMVNKPSQFPVCSAGVWGEAIRGRKPLILNEYDAAHQGKKGLPEGHVALSKLLVVPFFSHNRIVAVAAVANRKTDYGQEDVDQITAFLVSVQAIADSKRAEEELRESEERLRMTAEAGNAGLWDWDLRTNRVQFSEVWKRQIGFEEHEISNDFSEWQSRVHPDDLDGALASVQAFLSAPHLNFENEFRFRHKDGSYRTILARASLHYGEDGKPDRMLGSHYDITERKRAEEALRESEERLRLAHKATNDVVWDWDIVHDMQRWNEAGTVVFGWTEIVERPVSADWWVQRVHPDDRQRVDEGFFGVVNNPEAEYWQDEYRFLKADGSYAEVIDRGYVLRDEHGEAVRMIGAMHDNTDRKRAEEELERIRWMLSGGQPITAMEGRDSAADQGYGDLTELNCGGLILHSVGKDVLEEITDEYMGLMGTSSAIYEKNGDYAYGIFSSGWCRLMDRASRNLCATKDNAAALNSGKWLCHESCWTQCSKECIARGAPVDTECNGGIRLYTVPIFAGGQIVGSINFGHGDPPKDPARLKELAGLYQIEYSELLGAAKAYNSRPAYIVELAKKRLLASARLIGALVERNLAEQALQESGKRYRALFEQVGDGILLLDVRGEILSVNEAFASMHGYTEEEALHLELKELDVEGKARFPERMRQIMGGETITFDVEHYHKDGHTFPLSVTANLILSGNERLIIVVHRDLTERRRAEEALRESEERYRELVENANSIIIRMDNLGNIVFFNEFAQRFFGYNEEEILGRNVVGTIVPETDHSGRDLRAMILDIGVHPERYPSNENENMLRDGTRVWVSWTNKPLFDSAGRVREILCVGNDATARKRVEEEKAKLEAQLQQAQKMESVGRLAGGVAHDFNNMLQIILINADFAMDKIPPDNPLRESLEEIQSSARRSADLTRQLLAFARKQTVAPKMLDLNETLAGMLKMLQRLIGENIELDWQPGENLWAINMDPSQIDQILANLCVNARDAIVDVGKLTISTGNSAFDEDYCEKNPGFAPGEYVRLAVSDNGCGMDSETLSHIFEPFFTTKGFGEGTGLGLATVYGAVKQNNGFINVCSETGHGTTFTIYLPRHLGKAEQMRAGGPAKAGASGHETILLVEDDPSVLKLTARLLKGQGYNLLPALTPGDAIRLAREYSGEIHLLVTDVIMPEMNGRDLAGNVQSLYPNIKRLFMSGYTGDIIASQGVLDKGVHFIQKPFSVQRLLAEVRAALGSG